MQLLSSTLTPAYYVPHAPSVWMNCDTPALTSLALRTMLISTCQSMSSSKFSSRLRSQQTTVLWTLQILTDFWCQCVCAPARWSHHGTILLWYGEVRFLCFGALSDCRICGDCAFNMNSKRTVCTDVFWCLCCWCLCSLSKCMCKFLPISESDFWFQCLFVLLLSSFCFNVLSVTLTFWIVESYLLRAPNMSFI